MDKKPNLTLDDYIAETTTNIREDRAMAKSLLMDAINDMKITDTARRELGPIAAKYVENLQRSNEQLVKLCGLMTKQEKTDELSDKDYAQIFEQIQKSEEK